MRSPRLWTAALAVVLLTLVVGAGDLLPESWPGHVVTGVLVAGLVAGVALPLSAKVLERRVERRSRDALPPGVFHERLNRITGPGVLGVRPARAPYPRDGAPRFPVYVKRAADDGLRRALTEHGFVVLAGRPGSGKSRALFEALRTGPRKRWIVVAPGSVEELIPAARYVATRGRCLLWLDDLPRFLDEDGRLPAAPLYEVLDGGPPARVVASVSSVREEDSGRWLLPPLQTNVDARLRQLPVENPPGNSTHAWELARKDGRIADALRQWEMHRVDLAHYLAAGTRALEDWESLQSAADPRPALLVQAACDLRRMGMAGSLPVDAVEMVYRCHRGDHGREEDLAEVWRLAGAPQRTGDVPSRVPKALLVRQTSDPRRCHVGEEIVDELQRDPDRSIGRPLPELVSVLLEQDEALPEVLSAIFQESLRNGDAEQGERIARRRVELALSRSAGVEEIVRLRVDHARALQYMERWADADRVLEGALSQSRGVNPEGTWAEVGVLVMIALKGAMRGTPEAVQGHVARTLEIIDRWPEPPEDDPLAPFVYQADVGQVLETLRNAGVGGTLRPDPGELCRQAFEELRRRLPADHYHVLLTQVIFGWVLLGDEKRAYEAADMIIDATERLGDHWVGTTLTDDLVRSALAFAYLEKGLTRDAAEIADAQIPYLRRQAAEGDELSAVQLSNFLVLRSAEEEDPVLLRALLDEATEVVGNLSHLRPDIVHQGRLLIAMYQFGGRDFDDAYITLDHARAGLFPTMHTGGEPFHDLGLFLARYELRHRPPQEAEETARRVTAVFGQVLAPEDPVRREAVYTLGEVLSAQGRHQEAEPYFAEALLVDGDGTRPGWQPTDTSDPTFLHGIVGALGLRGSLPKKANGSSTDVDRGREHRPSDRPLSPWSSPNRQHAFRYTSEAMEAADRECGKIDRSWAPGTSQNQGRRVDLVRGSKRGIDLLKAERVLRSVALIRDRAVDAEAPSDLDLLLARVLESQGKRQQAAQWRRRHEDSRCANPYLVVEGTRVHRSEVAEKVRTLSAQLDDVLHAVGHRAGVPDPAPLSGVERRYRDLHDHLTGELGPRHPGTKEAAHLLGDALAAQSRIEDAHRFHGYAVGFDTETGSFFKGTRRRPAEYARSVIGVWSGAYRYAVSLPGIARKAEKHPWWWTDMLDGAELGEYAHEENIGSRWRLVLGRRSRYSALASIFWAMEIHAAGAVLEAERELRGAVMLLDASGRKEDFLHSAAMWQLGRMLTERERPSEAAYWARRVARVLTRVFGEEHPATLQLGIDEFMALQQAKHVAVMEERFEDLHPGICRVFGVGSEQDIQLLLFHSWMLRKTGRAPEVERLLNEMRDSVRERHPQHSPVLETQLAFAIHEQGRFEEARPLLQRARESLAEIGISAPEQIDRYLAESSSDA